MDNFEILEQVIKFQERTKNIIDDNPLLIDTIYRCHRCGKEFIYEPSSIHHANLLSGWNLHCSVKRGDLIEKFKDSDISERKCAYIWLEKNKFNEELKMMKEHFKDE
jgi:uncharacterized C2H2 Zn-finger protein